MSELPSSPEDDGIPSHASDDSYAYDQGDRPSFDDSPAALPGYEPTVLPPEEVGPEEAADLAEQPASEDAAEFDHERYVDSQSGVGVTDDEDDLGVIVDVAPVDSTLDGTADDYLANDTDVTLYDVDDRGDPVGRLIDPGDDGAFDSSSESIAVDTNEIEGMSAEEAAMHIVDDPDASVAQ